MCLQRFAETLVRYGCWTVYGDAYTAGWVVSAFSERGIEYRLPTKRDSDAKMDRSQLYLELLPMVNSRQVVLLRNDRLERQLCLLERSSGASGREKVDHPRGAHDDLANAAAGALVMTMQRGALLPPHRLQTHALGQFHDPFASREENQAAMRREEAQLGWWSGHGNSPTWHGPDDDDASHQQTHAL